MTLTASLILSAVLCAQAAPPAEPGAPFSVTEDIQQQGEQSATQEVSAAAGESKSEYAAKLKALHERIFKLELALMDKSLSKEKRAELQAQLDKLRLEHRKLCEAWLDAKAAKITKQLQDPSLTDQQRTTLALDLAAVEKEKQAQKARFTVLDDYHKLQDPALTDDQRKELKAQLDQDLAASVKAKGDALQAEKDYLQTALEDPALADDPAKKAALEKRLAQTESLLSFNKEQQDILGLRAALKDPSLTEAQRAELKKQLANGILDYAKDRVASLEKSLKDKGLSTTLLSLVQKVLAALKGNLSALMQAAEAAKSAQKSTGGTKLPAIPAVGDGQAVGR